MLGFMHLTFIKKKKKKKNPQIINKNYIYKTNITFKINFLKNLYKTFLK